MNTALDLFDGATFDAARDGSRLNAQQKRVWELVRDGRWRSLGEISEACGDPEASVSARLRDFRKPQFGGHTVERRYVSDGLWEYRLVTHTRGGEHEARTAGRDHAPKGRT